VAPGGQGAVLIAVREVSAVDDSLGLKR
jgi:hypothetical protein